VRRYELAYAEGAREELRAAGRGLGAAAR